MNSLETCKNSISSGLQSSTWPLSMDDTKNHRGEIKSSTCSHPVWLTVHVMRFLSGLFPRAC